MPVMGIICGEGIIGDPLGLSVTMETNLQVKKEWVIIIVKFQISTVHAISTQVLQGG